MDYEQFKIDVKSMDIWDFMNKWKNHPKYEEYNQKNMMKISMNMCVNIMIMINL